MGTSVPTVRCYFSSIFFSFFFPNLFYSFNLVRFVFFFFHPFRPQNSLPPVERRLNRRRFQFISRKGGGGVINNLTFIHLNLVTLIEKIQPGCGFDCSLTRG